MLWLTAVVFGCFPVLNCVNFFFNVLGESGGICPTPREYFQPVLQSSWKSWFLSPKTWKLRWAHFKLPLQVEKRRVRHIWRKPALPTSAYFNQNGIEENIRCRERFPHYMRTPPQRLWDSGLHPLSNIPHLGTPPITPALGSSPTLRSALAPTSPF